MCPVPKHGTVADLLPTYLHPFLRNRAELGKCPVPWAFAATKNIVYAMDPNGYFDRELSCGSGQQPAAYGLAPEVLKQLKEETRREFPTDQMIYELRLLRAVKAAKEESGEQLLLPKARSGSTICCVG